MSEACYRKVEKYLKENGIEEAKAEAKLIVEGVSGLSCEQLFLGEAVKNEDEIFAIAKKRVETGAPVQHLLGFAHFMGQKFTVNENVLIPRDETELLVREALKLEGKSALDVGTGSGCIACSLALFNPNLQVLGLDISTSALTVAINNALSLGLENRAVFRKSDLFSNVRGHEKFDIIVSNPPYIPFSQKDKLQSEVRFDPSLALFAKDEEGLEFYEKITSQAQHFLNSSGHVLFEVGQGQAQSVAKMFLKCGFSDINVIEDISGIERVVCAKV